MLPIRVNGIYNLATLELLSLENIQHIGIDFRPKSFNFLQLHKTKDIFDQFQIQRRNIQIFLQFDQQPSFIIHEILKELKDYHPIIEFTESVDGQLLKEIKHPFLYTISNNHLNDILKNSYCTGLIMEHEYLRELSQASQLSQYREMILKGIADYRRSDLKLDLKLSTEETLMSSLIDIFTFRSIVFDIGPLVEAGYRVVDKEKIQQRLNYIQTYLD